MVAAAAQPQFNLEIGKSIFNPVYWDFVTHHRKTEIYYGGGSSGKSFAMAERTVIDVLHGHNYLCVRNTAVSLKTSVYNEICKAIDLFKAGRLFSINKSDMTITCINGAQILFKGLDDVEKVKSITPKKGVITDVWIEEATETKENAINQLQVRLRGKSNFKKRIILTFNPIDQNHWIYKRYFTNWDDSKNYYEDEDLSILRTTYKDNEFLEDEDIERLESLKAADELFYNVYALGQWGILGDIIYKNIEKRIITPEERASFYPRDYGADFGFIHPSVCLEMFYDKNNETLYILNEVFLRGASNKTFAEEIIKKMGYITATCDSAQPGSISEIKNYGITALAAVKGPDSVNNGIRWLATRKKIVIDPITCPNSILQFQLYHRRQDKLGNTLDQPVDEEDDACDACRYGLEKYLAKPKQSARHYSAYRPK